MRTYRGICMEYDDYTKYCREQLTKGYLCKPKYKAVILGEKDIIVDVKSIHIGTGKIMYGYSDGPKHYGNRTCSFSDCILLECLGVTDNEGNDLYEGDVLADSFGFGEEFVIHRVSSPIKVGWVLIGKNESIYEEWKPNTFHKVGNIYERRG